LGLALQLPRDLPSDLIQKQVSFLRFFAERTETRNVRGWGCQFPLRMEVSEEAVLAIRVVRQHEGDIWDLEIPMLN
jgi:hypothetical protein